MENMTQNMAAIPELNLYNQLMSNYLDNDEIFKREIDENFVWFNGRPESIEVFFKNLRVFYNMSSPSMISAYDINAQMYNFWKDVGGDMARIHSGIPALISKTFGNLIKPSSIIMKVLKEDGTVDEKEQKRLKAILDDNQWNSLSKKGVITESWGGFFFLKLSSMEGFKYPIIEVVDPRQGRAISKRGRIIGYKFSTNEVCDGNTYELIEKYMLEKGKVIVSYDVYKGRDEVIAAAIPNDLKEKISTKKLNLKFLPVFLKNNTPYSSKFPNKIYGESDYSNSQSLFHMVDSILSNLELDIDNSKAITFVNRNLLEFDDDNDAEMFNKHKLRIFLSNKIMDDPEFDINKMIALFQPDLRIEQFDPALKDITIRTLANAGLSPSSVGMPGYESVNASNLSQTARRENSIISRDEKLELWLPFLKDFSNKLLQFDDFINGREPKEYTVFVEYNKYIAPDLNTLTNIVVKAVNGGVMSLEQALKLMWPDKSPDEMEALVEKIKQEMADRSTKAEAAIKSFDTPGGGKQTKESMTGRTSDEDSMKDLEKFKK